jgi:hypothetical protein
MLRYRVLKVLGCFAIASESGDPSRTSWVISETICLSFGLLTWTSSTSRSRMMGTPARNMVRNCFVNRMSSCIETPPTLCCRLAQETPSRAARSDAPATRDGIHPRLSRSVRAASGESASIVPLTLAPVSLMAS